jgi:uncharacterized membrane protein (UPF0136 family)
MNAHIANLLNAVVLLAMGFWGYMDKNAPTALIPVVFGVILIVMSQGVKNENKAQAHVAVIVTLVALLGILKPFFGAIGKGDSIALFRTGLMVLTGIVSMVFFIRSFIAAKKAREAAAKQ